jgi:hypothetical protein
MTLKQENPWDTPRLNVPELVAHLLLYPPGHTLDPQLASQLVADWESPAHLFLDFPAPSQAFAGVFADLDGDGVEEFVLLTQAGGPVYQRRSGRWQYIGRMYPHRMALSWETIRGELDSGKLAAAPPQWLELAVGAARFRLDATESDAAVPPVHPQ